MCAFNTEELGKTHSSHRSHGTPPRPAPTFSEDDGEAWCLKMQAKFNRKRRKPFRLEEFRGRRD